MYISPTQLLDRVGGTELAELATPDQAPVVDAELMAATIDGSDRSAWSPAEIAVADHALVTIQTACDDATSLCNGYLAKRYTLPFAGPMNLLVVWARAIARYYLHKDRRTLESDDPVVRDYRDALKSLQLVANGKLSLGADDPTVADGATGGDVQFESDPTVFGRDEMRSFR